MLKALRLPEVDVHLLGNPEVNGKRQMGVTLARAETVEDAKSQALNAQFVGALTDRICQRMRNSQ